MKIELWSMGKPNEKIFDAAITEFANRINRYSSFSIKTIASKAKPTAPVQQQIDAEGAQLLSLLQDNDFVIALDDEGKQLNTEKLATELNKWLQLSSKKIVFIIGGAYGLSNDLLNRAQYKLSLSALTFPHQLVRLIATEQLYRAFTILRNENYHHSE